jgi:hypothetical protein
MFRHATDAKYINDYRVWLEFDDGKEAEIDLMQKIKNRGGVFTLLQDINYFKNFKIENDTLSWENGADLALESLYELLKQQNPQLK